ncbi:MAG: hypothetical protein LBR42_03130, partial [Candidatus Methanoplasma sp.]|nr:hypothetical protein [Candidatus Methanoplasma sp.]
VGAYFPQAKAAAFGRLTDVDLLVEVFSEKNIGTYSLSALVEKLENMLENRDAVIKMAPFFAKFLTIYTNDDNFRIRLTNILIVISKKHPEVIKRYWGEIFNSYDCWHFDMAPNHTDTRKYSSASDCHSDSGVHTDRGMKNHTDTKPGFAHIDRFPPYVRE